ncbi:MAG TPA: MarR family transcriptional regulator [Actinomycetota bacterium]|nr:MarR family transcriptional regulator [Actinomycetota bacterium]
MKKRCEATGRFEVWPMLLVTHSHLIDKIEDKLESVGGLSASSYDVLAQLALAPGKLLKMADLAESVLLSKSGVTRLVDRMAAEGYIERTACPTDRRIVYAQLTKSGEQLFRKARPVVKATVEKHFTDFLSDTEAMTMKRALGRVLDAAEGYAQTGGGTSVRAAGR